MGWLTMTRMAMGGHETPKAYLDAQLTYERKAEGDTPFGGLRVLRVSIRETPTMPRPNATTRTASGST